MKAVYAILVLILLINLSPAYSADPLSFTCNYPTVASQDGLEKASDFVLRFVVDAEKDTAYFIGNNGSTEVIVIVSIEGSITFVEVTDAKNVMTTTITKGGDSVHSRNSVIWGDLVPSQYYGKCIVQ